MSDRRLSPTVYGIETEYTCMLTFPGNVVHEIVGRCHSADTKLGLYKEPEKMGGSSIPGDSLTSVLEKMSVFRTGDGMLSNGGRLYIDPSGPEYATPETSTAEEAVYRSFDGDEILLGAFERLRQEGILENFQVNRRIVDHNRTSRGIHLNTTTNLVIKELSLRKQGWFAALNVAKGAIFGSGGLLIDEHGDSAFHHSPRLSITTDLAREYTEYKNRPLVRYPFKEDGKLKRIETVTSDALNFAWPLRASMVATNALTAVIELGYSFKLPQLRDPVRSAHIVGRYGNENYISAIDKFGQEFVAKPLDILRNICEVVLEVDSIERHLDKESDQVILEIIDVADRMSADMYSVATQVESVARLIAMNRKMDRDHIKLDSEKMCRFDFAWDLLAGGIAETLRNKRAAGWQGFKPALSAKALKRRLITPPQDTRAKVRGEMIESTAGHNDSDWCNVDYGPGPVYLHPFDTEIPEDDLNYEIEFRDD